MALDRGFMSILEGLNEFSDTVCQTIFEQTNTVYPKQDFLVIAKRRALIYAFLPFLVAILSIMIYFFVDYWVVRLISAVLASFIGLGHALYFSDEMLMGISHFKTIAFKEHSSCFFLIPNWLNNSIYIVNCMIGLFLGFIVYKIFWG